MNTSKTRLDDPGVAQTHVVGPNATLGALRHLKRGQEIRLGVCVDAVNNTYGMSRPRKTLEAADKRQCKKTDARLKMEADAVDEWPGQFKAVAEGFEVNPAVMPRGNRRKFYKEIPLILEIVAGNLKKPVVKLTTEEIAVEAAWLKWQREAPRGQIMLFARINGRPPHRFPGKAGLNLLEKLERIEAPVVRLTAEQLAAIKGCPEEKKI